MYLDISRKPYVLHNSYRVRIYVKRKLSMTFVMNVAQTFGSLYHIYHTDRRFKDDSKCFYYTLKIRQNETVCERHTGKDNFVLDMALFTPFLCVYLSSLDR